MAKPLTNRFGISVIVVVLLPGMMRGEDAPPPVRFSRDVLPILSENCFACHGPDAKARKADLRLDVHAAAARVLTPGDSELIRRIDADVDNGRMPPPKSHRTLSAAQKDLLRRWVDQGAVWGKHWAYETPERPQLPAVQNAAWCRNPLDRFIMARLEKEGLTPAQEATRETLIRRVTLDLTGLPPSPSEVDDFLADQSPSAYERVVSRLLASSRFGERAAVDWLDAARYADTNGYQNDFARTMWPWRDWVIKALNSNVPFDRFIVDQIAGDKLPHPSLEQRIATGFNRNNRTVTEGGSIDEEWRVENGVDRVETTATALLGLTLGCCRCHDHKFDPISQAEFYQFYAFFNSLNEKGVYNEQRGNVLPLVQVRRPEEEYRLQEFDRAIAGAEKAVQKQRAALAVQQLHGKEVQHALPLPFAVPDWVLRFALAFRREADPELIKAKNKLTKIKKEKEAFEKGITTVMVMEDLPSPRPTYVLVRGQYDRPDKNRPVEPGVPACLPPLPAGAPRNRLGLARWLVDPHNPLTARVAVNRFWQRYFGVGLVSTTENFGVQGEAPSNPELLDWLATEFVACGWDVKHMQRLIVTSAAYRQSSTASPALLQRDPDNRLIARGPHFRLPAEVVRDNALAISGLLTERLFGPSVKPYQPAGLWEEMAGDPTVFGKYVQDKGPVLYRRGLYLYRKRTVPHPSMANFDAPSREFCLVRRARTDTPMQALELLNDVTFVEAARHLAELMLTSGGVSPEERTAYGFRRAVARRPTPAEVRVLTKGLEFYLRKFRANAEAARRFVHQGESPVNEQLNVAELAAYSAVAGVILNLDETITKD